MTLNHKSQDFLILISVFITGASFLVIEIVAMRILAPYYGNTIYTTSSVIGTVLAALSFGYYSGGKLSDKYPKYKLFYGIIFISGLLAVLIQFLSVTLLPILSVLFSISVGPFISSIFLFSIPSFSLGMLSPFAIKLYKKSNIEAGKDIGEHSGTVLFWGTLGSIVGSFLSGFILIPHFGINSIIIGTGIILSTWSIIWFLLFYKKNQKIIWLMIVGLLILASIWFSMPKNSKEFIFQKDGVYEKIRIQDRVWNGHPTRFLYQDRSWSSAMYLDSDELVFDYTKYYELYRLFNQNPKDIFVIGGGAYSIPKAILKNSPNANIDVSEIEPEYFNLSKKYFNLEDTDKLNNLVEDGRRILTKNQKKYDAIISDVYYSIFSMPIHFTTKEFFTLSKSRLSDNGVFIGNFIGNLEPKNPSFILSEIKTFKGVFENSYFFAVKSPLLASGQNIIFLGVNGDKKIDFKSDEVIDSQSPIIRDLAKKSINIDNFNLSSYDEITDNFAPVEYLVGKDISKFYQ